MEKRKPKITLFNFCLLNLQKVSLGLRLVEERLVEKALN